jgi:hypothetical protein
MRLRLVITRFAVVASSLALFLGAVTVAHFAMADGIERGRRAAHHRHRTEVLVPNAPEVTGLVGGPAPEQIPAAAPDLGPCGSLENAYRAISHATEGEDITAIKAALAEVQADPSGAHSDPNAATLANRLRRALAIDAATPCEPVQTALRDSAQLAQLASNAGPTTAAIGEPPPLSPSYNPIPSGTPGGARGHGYCVNLGHCES